MKGAMATLGGMCMGLAVMLGMPPGVLAEQPGQTAGSWRDRQMEIQRIRQAYLQDKTMTADEAREQLRPLVQAEVEERQAAGTPEHQLEAMEQLAASLAAHEERLDQMAYQHIDRLLDQAEAGRTAVEPVTEPLPNSPVAAFPRQREIVARLEREAEELRSRGDAAAEPGLKALEERIAVARVLSEFQDERLGRDEARQQLLSLVRGYARTPSAESGLGELDRRRTQLEQRLAEMKQHQADSSALVEERLNEYLQ